MSSRFEQILPAAAKPPQLITASDAKRELLERLLRGEANEHADVSQTILPRALDTKAQLSFAQERLWFLDQLMPDSPFFNVPLAVRLRRPVKLDALQRSVNEIIRRHEVLRTAFVTVDAEPSLIISPCLESKIKIIELGSLDATTAEAESRKLIHEEVQRPFDVSRAPLIRTTLIRLSATDSILLLTMHHIVSDGWSLLLFFKELAALYEGFLANRAPQVPALTIQYADYALWQKDWLRDEVVKPQLAYWKDQLGGDLPILDLPTDSARPVVQTYNGAREVLTLTRELTQSLTELSQRAGATLFMTLLAAFKVLLHRLSGQNDIIVGSPIANRPRAETENLIGFFLNNLALRSDLSGNPKFTELLSRVRQTALDAYSNQDVPFEKLVEELKPERDLSRTSIFQVYFNLFSFSDQVQLPGGGSTNFVDAWLQAEEAVSKFDLTLYAGVGKKEIKLAFVYKTDLFTPERMTEMMRQFECLLEQIVAKPEQPIGSYALLTPATATVIADPTEPLEAHKFESITALVSKQAQRRPNQAAVVDVNRTWTYRELESRSNQLANYLRANGIRKRDVVAIYAHRSAPLVSAIVGVLKAGGAFTIVDPAHPAARMIDCLQVASPRAFIHIADAGLLPQELSRFLESIDCTPIITLSNNGNSEAIRYCSTEDPNVTIDADDLAYIAFTSGSTGTPKGVMGRHGPLTLFTSWAAQKFGLNETDRFCMLSGLAHDPLHRDIFTPLQLGGTICIPGTSDMEAPGRLRVWMKAQRITVANLTPAMAQLLCEQHEPKSDGQINSLRYSFLVGDVLKHSQVARLKQLAPAITTVNLFGATETQRAVSYYVPDAATASAKQVLPLGKGITDVQLLLLNGSEKLCGIGELGEICFRSPHLAAGYLGDAKLTAQRFIHNQFTNNERDRLYRTGDLGRYLPDGNVEHAGRADRQLKIRGFRIEPGEIEAAITKSGGAREAAVIFRNDSQDLVAYVVPAEGAALTSDKLRWVLGEKLPAYMVPKNFVIMAALPLTPNRKLDRRALPDPAELAIARLSNDTAPSSPTEQTLVEIWQTVLGISSFGVHDNFFELGGHSLIAVRLFALIEKQFGKRLPLATLFRAPTVAQLAAILDTQDEPRLSSLVPIQPRGSRPPFFCVHAVGGNVLEYYDLAKHLGMDQPFYGLQSRGLNGEASPHTTINEMAAHYIREMREVQPLGPYFIGGRSLGGIIAYEMACQLRAAGHEVGSVSLLDSYPVGYERVSNSGHVIKRRAQHFRKRFNAHWQNIQSLPARDKLSYIFNKSKYGPVRIKSKLWRTIYRSYKNSGRDLPKALNDVEQFNWLAAQNYRPQTYDGRVTLFWASQDLRAKFDMLEGWRALARGGVELIEVAGTHLDIIKEPHVGDVAKKLNACLVTARS